MRFVDEYRSADMAQRLGEQIAGLVQPGRRYELMEVCVTPSSGRPLRAPAGRQRPARSCVHSGA